LYNAARPFRVIGGVSDAEIELLQAARGPLAKVALVSMWLQEFITRECLAGSTGNVASPVLSRLYQFVSDGMVGYNQARKVAYVPFPFAHARTCVCLDVCFAVLSGGWERLTTVSVAHFPILRRARECRNHGALCICSCGPNAVPHALVCVQSVLWLCLELGNGHVLCRPARDSPRTGIALHQLS
jgi:hypothetical protein